MPGTVTHHETVSMYPMDRAVMEQLFEEQREFVFAWATRDSWPVGVTMSYMWRDGRFWTTATKNRHRVSAVQRNPKVSVIVSSAGTSLGRARTVTAKGACVVHDDRPTIDWFLGQWYDRLSGESDVSDDERARFVARLDSPLRVVLEIVPEQWISYDSQKMWAHVRGELSLEELGMPLSSDTVRLTREYERRGLVPPEIV